MNQKISFLFLLLASDNLLMDPCPLSCPSLESSGSLPSQKIQKNAETIADVLPVVLHNDYGECHHCVDSWLSAFGTQPLSIAIYPFQNPTCEISLCLVQCNIPGEKALLFYVPEEKRFHISLVI